MVGTKSAQQADVIKKKNTKSRKPTSLNVTRTNEFLEALAKKYGRYLTLSGGSIYKGIRHKLSFRCEICGHISETKASTMLKGTGCRKCRTNSDHIQSMIKHMDELLELQRFRLAIPPVTFSAKSKYSYMCLKCDALHLARPSEAEDKDFICTKCTAGGKRGTLIRLYANRLHMLYRDQEIICLDMYSNVHSMSHMCRRSHVWEATAKEMLTGLGCPRCAKPVQVRYMDAVEAHNKIFFVRNKLERDALRCVKELAGSSLRRVYTTFSYPIPPTLSNHTAAFYVADKNLLVDVIAFSKVLNSRSQIVKSQNRAHELGYEYSVVTIRVEGSGDSRKVAHEVLSSAEIKAMRKQLVANRKSAKLMR